jgi:hypothetical protein
MSEEPKYELMRDTAPPLPYDIVGPREFAQAWVQLLGTQPHVWWLCAERFDDWPFEQPEVADALVAWSKARPQGRVYILAREFAWVERNAAVFLAALKAWSWAFTLRASLLRDVQITLHTWPLKGKACRNCGTEATTRCLRIP